MRLPLRQQHLRRDFIIAINTMNWNKWEVHSSSRNPNPQTRLIESLQAAIRQAESDNQDLRQQLKEMGQKQMQSAAAHQHRIATLQHQNGQLKRQLQQLKAQFPHPASSAARSQRMSKSTNLNMLPNHSQNCDQSNVVCQGCANWIQEREKITDALKSMCQDIESLIQGYTTRKVSSDSWQDEQAYQCLLREGSRNNRLRELKDPFALFSNLQKRIQLVQKASVQTLSQKEDPLMESMETMRQKQQYLLRVPFLQEVIPTRQKQQCDRMLDQAKAAATRIRNMVWRQDGMQ